MNMNIVATYCEDDRYVWCLTQGEAYLYRLDKEQGLLEQISPLLDDVDMRWAYSNILGYNNYLIFVPCNADEIVLVNRDNLEKEYIELPIVESYVGKSTFKFFTGIVYQDTLFLFGYAYPGIVKVDLVSKRVEVKDFGLNDHRVILNNENDGCFHVQYVLLEDTVYFPFMNANAVLAFNMKTEESQIYIVGTESERYISIEWDGECFWLIPRDGRSGVIVKWDLGGGNQTYFQDFPTEFDYHEFAFYRTESINNKILLFAHSGMVNVEIDIDTGNMKCFPHLYDVERVSGCKYQVIWKQNDCIWILKNDEWIMWDVCEAKAERVSYKWDEKTIQFYRKEIKDKYEKFSQKSGYVVECGKYNLNAYLQYVSILAD